jgi:hypothetical protein
MADWSFIECTYPNGSPYLQVWLNGVKLGHLVEGEAGFTARGWRKPVASKDAALEKLRTAGVADRKRKIAALQAEIDKMVVT